MRKLIVLVMFLFVSIMMVNAQNSITPSQAEGPYYPVRKPEDRDWNLVEVSGRQRVAEGALLELEGSISSLSNAAVSGLTVEIWQTDAEGRYMHPSAPGTKTRDMNFQFYGEVLTDEEGRYRFLTILPERYGSRPRHIHVKVKTQNGRELLTTQFYFPEDGQLKTDILTRNMDDKLNALMVNIIDGKAANGQEVIRGKRDIVLR